MILSPRANDLALCLATALWTACGSVAPATSSTKHVEPETKARVEQSAPALAPKPATTRKKPTELFEIVKVVDGDTIHIKRGDKVEKLRLLSVDTEEKIGAGAQPSSTKPPTVFGEECALWAQQYFAALAKDGAPPKVGIVFPGGVETRDFYGRLLCEVILPDGTNYDLMLVELGKSPYFTKYGRDQLDHQAFVAAQKQARAAQRGIWNPKTNVPSTPGAPAAKRPYDKLVPWWDARGEAVESYRAALASNPARVCDADSGESLARAAALEDEVDVFGEIDRVRTEADGSETVHFRAAVKAKSLVVRVPKEHVAAHATLDLPALGKEFRQNYAWFHGRVRADERGFNATSDDPNRWKRAGPEP